MTIEKSMYKHQSTLVENRLNLVELTKINPNSALVMEQTTRILSKLEETNKKGSEEIDHQGQLPKAPFNSNEDPKQLLSESKSIYEKQKPILEKLSHANSLLYNIFAFSPTQQFSKYPINSEKALFIEEIDNAISGLNSIKNKSKELSTSDDTLKIFHEQVDTVTTDLNNLKKAVSEANNAEISKNTEVLRGRYRNLRISALNVIKSFVREDEAINLLKNQADIIYRFEKLQSQIDNELKSFSL